MNKFRKTFVLIGTASCIFAIFGFIHQYITEINIFFVPLAIFLLFVLLVYLAICFLAILSNIYNDLQHFANKIIKNINETITK